MLTCLVMLELSLLSHGPKVVAKLRNYCKIFLLFTWSVRLQSQTVVRGEQICFHLSAHDFSTNYYFLGV